MHDGWETGRYVSYHTAGGAHCIVDYVHDGHLHAAHEGHYDEHGSHGSSASPDTDGYLAPDDPGRPHDPAASTTGRRP